MRITASACYCLVGHFCRSEDNVSDAARLGILELALSALRAHRSNACICGRVSELLCFLCFDEARAINAKKQGAPALLQAALKAHPCDESVQEEASEALARIQRFVEAAFARAEANMAELIAGEDAAKEGKGAAAVPKKAGRGKGKSGGGAAIAPAPPPPPQPPVAAGDIPVLTKAQIKRRKAKAAAAARKAAAAPGSAAGEEEEEEEGEGADTSSDVSEPFRPRRPPLDFSADGEFRRSMHLPRRPGIEAEIDKMVAEGEAWHAAKLAAAAATPLATRDAVGAMEEAAASGGAVAAARYPPSSSLSFSSAVPRLAAAPSSISLHASLLAEAATAGAAASADAVWDPLPFWEPLPSPSSPLTSPHLSDPTAHAAKSADAALFPSSSHPSAPHAAPPDVGCSSPLCAAEIDALRGDAAASRSAAVEKNPQIAALRARVAELEAENASLRG